MGLGRALIAASVGMSVTHPAFSAARQEVAVISLRREAEQPVPERALRALAKVIERSDGLTAVDSGVLTRRLAGRLRPPPAVESGVSDALERESRELLEAVAYGRDDETIARGKAVIRREGVRLTATNRSEAASRALADICLFVLRALMHRSDESGARSQARECLRLVPDLTPPIETHPPQVRTLVAAMRSERLGRLAVAAVAPASRTCVLSIQGRRAGPLPVEIELPPGAYSIQADCGSTGLVREIVVRAGATERIAIAPRLERALRLERPTVLHLERASVPLEAEELALYAEWLAVSELWTLERRSSVLQVTRWERASGGLLEIQHARVVLEPAATLEDRLGAAAIRMLCVGVACGDADQPVRPPAPAAGIALAGAGVAAMLGSWIAWNSFRELDDELAELDLDDPQYAETHSVRNTFGTIALVTTVGGSAMFAVAAPLWLPPRRDVPWWAWASGAAGGVGIGVGVALWIDHRNLEPVECPPDVVSCGRFRSTVPLVPMLLTQGASLSALPLTYVIRNWTRSAEGALAVDFSRHGFTVSWSGRARVF
jgi:hypothetical protein